MEPVLPEPHVVVVGRSPGVKTLVRLLLALDWRTTVIDDGGEAGDWPAGVAVKTSLEDWDSISVGEAAAVVVATQGHYDEPALEAALRSGAPYVGLVASATRAESVLAFLRDRGFGDADIARIDTPAGMDLGHVEHREISVAILAELVRRRAGGLIGTGSQSATAVEPATAIDPVCGMTVEVAGARFVSEQASGPVYFCCPACKKLFEDDPAAYA